jgi:pyruvate ferredoxin oxidoreductase delta subunit
MSKKQGWTELPVGGLITEAGSADNYETGSWRTYRPIKDEKKCINCLICWVYCPDSSIMVEDGKMKGFDLKHCKGCGICAKVCPEKVKAITMVLETEAQKEEAKK